MKMLTTACRRILAAATSVALCAGVGVASQTEAGAQSSASEYTAGNWKLQVSLVPEKSSFMLGEPATLGEVIKARGRALLGADEFAAVAAAKALAAIDDERAADPFISAAAQSTYSVKLLSVNALARFATEAALVALQRAADDPDMAIRRAAAISVMLWKARDASDRFIRNSDLPPHCDKPIFLRMDDHGDEIWVVYKKTFRDERVESPADLTVTYNKTTGVTRWIARE